MKGIVRAWLCAGVALGASTAAMAQEAPPPPLAGDPPTTTPRAAPTGGDDIVVTANRREQSLRDVGISVAAFSGDDLKERGLSSTTDIAQLTPGVYASGSLGGQSQQFSIRGVTQSDFNDAIEAPVAVYVDDIYVPTQQGQTLALFDVQRVEVLKGPQGTLFGRNATGGLVNTVIVQPDATRVSGFADASYGRFNETKLEAAVNLPLGTSSAVRVSGYYNRIDNYWRNDYPAGVVSGAPLNYGPPGAAPSPVGEDEGGARTYAGRAQLKVEPAPGLTVRLMAQGAKQDLSTAPYTAVAAIGTYDAQGRLVQSDRVSSGETRLAIGPDGGNYTNFAAIPLAAAAFPGNGTRAPGATWFGYVPLDIDERRLSSDFARRRLNTTSGVQGAAHVDYDAGGATITSITAYQKYDKEFLMDGDGTPNNLFVFGTKAHTTAFSQELRVSGRASGFRWTAGGYYLDIDARTTQGLLGPRGSLLAGSFGLSAEGVDVVDVVRLKTKSLSMFGQTEIDLAPKVTFVLGGRIIRERQHYDFTAIAARNDDDYSVDDAVALFPVLPAFADRRSRTLWAGKAQLEYRPLSDLLVYAGVNRGVKGGSYNAPIADGSPPLAASQIPYGPETLWNYEAGAKYGDRFFSINLSTFYYDYQGYQAFLFRSNSGFVQNVDSSVYGVEGDVGVQVVDGLRATAAGSYTHATIPDFEIAPGVLRDVRPTYAPRTQLSGDLTYTVPGSVAGGDLMLSAQVNYASGFYHNLRNFNADWFDGRTLVNYAANWTLPDGLRIGAYLKNALDKRYGLIGFDSVANFGGNIESYGMPRTYGVTASYRF